MRHLETMIPENLATKSVREAVPDPDFGENPGVTWPRCILHADLDAFFASVEQLDDPAIRGVPVLVGGAGDRGVVAAASYEARTFGCRSAMPMREARRLCPKAVVRPPRFDRYTELSARFRAILLDHSPVIEPLSVDEAFVDATGSQRLLGGGERIAQSIRDRTRAELGVTVSVGVAACKFVAKIASDLRKPDGLTVIPAEEAAVRLAPLPIERMWGVGPRTAPRLHRLGVHTFADLQRRDEGSVRALLGEQGVTWRLLSMGIDERPVVCERPARSVGHEETFERDIDDPARLREVLQEQCERVALRLRASEGVARTVTLKLRRPDFSTATRSRTMDTPTDSTIEIWRCASALLDAWLADEPGPLRLLGIGVDRSEPSTDEPSLFDARDDGRQRALDTVTDQAIRRFGPGALRRGGSRDAGRRSARDATDRGPRPEAG
jgi:DNA polymerase-4